MAESFLGKFFKGRKIKGVKGRTELPDELGGGRKKMPVKTKESKDLKKALKKRDNPIGTKKYS